MTARKKQDGAVRELDVNAKEGGRDRVTVEDVLKMLEEDGIRDLQQFVKRQLAQAKASRKAPRRASLLGPSSTAGSKTTRGKAQRPVTVPVLIDGVLYDPKDIHRFDGQTLHFIAPSSKRPTLQALTGEQWPTMLRTYVQVGNVASVLQWEDIVIGGPPSPPSGGGTEPPNGGGVVIEPPPPPAAFFSDSQFQGDYLWLSHGQEWSDLTRVMRGDAWDRKSWNDTISSVSPNPSVGLVVLCEDINLGGASLSIPEAVRDLTLFGWNDRTSSIVYW